MKYVLYNKVTGNIVRTGPCSPSQFSIQGWSKPHLAVMEGEACDIEDMVDITRDKPRIIKRHVHDIKVRKGKLKLKSLPVKDQQANITNGQLEAFIQRLDALEGH